MKILSAAQTRLADAHTIAHEPIPSIDLMERAATRFTEAFYPTHDPKHAIAVVCGTGNNGGDGLAVSRILTKKGYSVQPFVVRTKEGGSEDFLINRERLQGVCEPIYIENNQAIPDFSPYKVIIDAIFGSGLSREVGGLYAQVIAAMNQATATIVAIDLPSGLFADAPSTGEAIVQAAQTISFQLPKLAFFMPENYKYVGEWLVADIGLDKGFINQQDTRYSTIEESEIIEDLPQRQKFDHKGTYGHGMLMGGSKGKMGAMVLAARAFLRSGAGLLTVTIPASGNDIMQVSAPEAMVLPQLGENEISQFNTLPGAATFGIGPGLGKAPATVKAFGDFLRENDKPLILDADALNIISENRELLATLPPDTIITPHLKEFDRLAGDSDNHWQRLEKAIDFAEKWQLVVVLKGAHTAIINRDGKVFFNTTGNPGMATGGSGDVLLGIITSLRTQGLSALAAAKAGTYIHGLAGDMAAKKKSMTALLAGDIIGALPEIFLRYNR